MDTWLRARRPISHRRFALNIKRMLEDDECDKLTSLPKELVYTRKVRERGEGAAFTPTEAEDSRTIFVWNCFAKKMDLEGDPKAGEGAEFGGMRRFSHL